MLDFDRKLPEYTRKVPLLPAAPQKNGVNWISLVLLCVIQTSALLAVALIGNGQKRGLLAFEKVWHAGCVGSALDQFGRRMILTCNQLDRSTPATLPRN